MGAMLIVRRLRLITPLLASKRGTAQDTRKVFSKLQRPPKNEDKNLTYIVSDLGRWEWAFLEARDALGFDDVATSSIIPSHWYAVKRTSTYNRKFRRGSELVTQPFEALPTGQIFEMKFTLSKHVPPGTDGNGRFTRAPDEEEFDEMLTHIGEYLGMSEWGHARKYGRFEIKNKHTDDSTKETKENRDSKGEFDDVSEAPDP